jgi:uncharacterized protein (TIGR02996 family)
MSALQAELEAAVKASSPVVSMLALCRAWALAPSTRVARLARGFARQLQVDAVPGDNQEERESAWLELAARAGPADLQELLASPWSKKPKDAVRRLSALARLGPDPRIVGSLLELDTGNRYASAAGHRFWQDVYELLLRWGSVEAVERVPKDLPASEHTSPWNAARYRAIFEPLAVRWSGRWPAEPALPASVTSLLEALELKLAPALRLTEGLLAAVQAAPSEDSPRLVFADALAEQGDSRGEFIALQFAHAAGELPLGKREHMQRLLATSGRAWFDGLEGQVAPLAVFHKGFLREVRLATRTPQPTAPAWSTVECIDAAGIATTLSSFLSHQNLARVNTLRSLRGGTLEELARHGLAREFALIEVSHLGGRDVATPEWTLQALRLLAPIDEAVWWFSGCPLRQQVATLSLQVQGAFERIGPAVRELQGPAVLEFASRAPTWPLPPDGDWVLRFERDTKGNFSRLLVTIGDEHFTGLEAALLPLPRDQLKSVRVNTSLKRGPSWRDQTRASIESVLRWHRRLTSVLFELDRPIEPSPRAVVHEGR